MTASSSSSSAPKGAGPGWETQNLLEDAEPEEADISGNEADISGAEADAALEEELFASEEKKASDTLALTVSDRLGNFGAVLDMVNIQSNPQNKEDQCIAACVGHGKHSAIAVLSQNLMYEKLLQVDLPNIQFLKTVYSTGANTNDAAAAGKPLFLHCGCPHPHPSLFSERRSLTRKVPREAFE